MTVPTPLVRARGAALRLGAFHRRGRRWRYGAGPRGDHRLVEAEQRAGVDPTGSRRAPVIHDEDETHDRYEEHPLHTAAPMIHECLSAIADEAGYLIVISDADGTLHEHRGHGQHAPARGGRHELRRGHVVERGRRRDERHRHRARGRPRGPGLRSRALRRPRPALDVQRVPDPRPGHRRGDRRDRPHGRAEHRPPPLARRRDRHGARRRGQPPARPAGARRAPARPLRRVASHPTAARSSRAPAAPSAPSRAAGSSPAGSPSHRAAASWSSPSGVARGGRARRRDARGVRRPRAGSPSACASISRPVASSCASSAATAPSWTRATRSPRCARAWPRSSRCCARTRTG